MSEEYKIIISQLKSNSGYLIKAYNDAHEMNKTLSDQVNILENEISDYKDRLNEIEKKYNSLKTAKVLNMEGNSSHDATQKINKLIREIDNCIALVNK